MIHDDLNSWLKASAENKITTKNTWQSTLIEHFLDSDKFTAKQGVNFQKASCTLEGCMKVYSTRIDDVSDNTLKLLEIFNKEDVKKKSNTKKKSDYIEKNLNNINLKEKDAEEYYDALFSAITTRNDDYFLLDIVEPTNEGLLLYTKEEKDIVMEDERVDIDPQVLPICDSLKDFEAIVMEDKERNYEPEFDVNDFTINQEDFRTDNSFTMNDNEQEDSNEEEKREVNIFHETPFGYFKGWAGPSHWKCQIGTTNKKKTENKPKKRAFIDFTNEIDRSLLENKAETVLSKTAILERRKNKNFLPEDYSYDIRDLYRFLKLDGYFGDPSCDSGPKKESRSEYIPKEEENAYDAMDFEENQQENDLSFQFEQSMVLNEKITEVENNQIQLKFTRIPKRVDIRKLKEKVSELITKETRTLSEIIARIPKVYEEKESKDISPHFCLISLLHLANEKGFEIENTGNDLLIKSS